MRSRKLLALLIALLFCAHLYAERYDVVIAGAGSGGTSAAIQAARMGMKVALLEETEYIGGQMGSAGVSNMDEGYNLTPPSGFYKEFLANMEAYYLARHQSVSTCYWGANSHCFEPIGIRRVLTAMIEETNRDSSNGGHITLLLRERVVAVSSTGKLVTGVTTLHHGTLNSAILIDATEWGDVIPLSPARYRISNQIGKPTHTTCTQDITYTMVIKKYPNGVPAELQMKDPPPDYDKYVENWRLNFRSNGNPDNRWLPVGFAEHNAYRGMPDPGSTNYVATQAREITKTGLNWFNDFPVDTGIFDRAKRQKYVCEAKLKSIGNLFYLQHEMGETQWSIANDQEYDTPYQREENLCPNIPSEYKAIERNMPQSPYVRESYRMVGEHTLVGSEIRRETTGGIGLKRFPSSIAVSDYPDDLHNCVAEENFEAGIERKSDDPPQPRTGPFQVPFESLIPEEVDGLLAAEKNISVSRLANGAIRLQPITMLTGEAVGALAALSIQQHIQPRKVSFEQLQVVLLQSGAVIASPPMADMPLETMPWQAAQLAVTHLWMETEKDGNFHPEEKLTRAAAARILSSAYSLAPPVGNWGPNPSTSTSSFVDVPLYSETQLPAESLKQAGAAPFCNGDSTHFCPADPMTRTEFVRMVQHLEDKGQQLESKTSPITTDELYGNMRPEKEEPISRGEAAIVLYTAMKHRAHTM